MLTYSYRDEQESLTMSDIHQSFVNNENLEGKQVGFWKDMALHLNKNFENYRQQYVRTPLKRKLMIGIVIFLIILSGVAQIIKLKSLRDHHLRVHPIRVNKSTENHQKQNLKGQNQLEEMQLTSKENENQQKNEDFSKNPLEEIINNGDKNAKNTQSYNHQETLFINKKGSNEETHSLNDEKTIQGVQQKKN